MRREPQEILIGMLLDPGPHVATGMLGILKAGYGFVPIDPEYPPERVDFILTDCRIKTLVTEAKYMSRARQLASKNPILEHIVCLDTVEETQEGTDDIDVYDARDCAREKPGKETIRVNREQLAYVVYTSGSTGTPKGVPITHENLVPLLLWGQEYLKLGEHTKTLQCLSYCFDFGIFEVLSTVLFGGTLYFLDKDKLMDAASYIQYVNEQGINTINSTPSFFRMLAALGIRLETLKLLHLGGEELTNNTLDEIFNLVGEQCIVYNGYGPTEATVTSSIFEVGCRSSRQYKASHSVPIGKVSANNRLYVLDKNCHLAPVGVPGELHIGGIGLTRGYLNQPELTAEKFIPNPFSDEPGARLYKTGDVVRYLPDGNIEFLGRVDYQVKIRGFRIELGEIETALSQHPAVQQAVVLARDDVAGEKSLVAYVVPKQAMTLTGDALRDVLREQLPDYMLPSAFVLLNALPLTPNGKVDRRALPAPDASPSDHTVEFVAPETTLEKKLAEIWAQVLGIERIGIYDDFFTLGGHSLKATQIIYRINQAFLVDLPLRSLFQDPTIAGLSLLIEETLIERLEERARQRTNEAKDFSYEATV